MKKLLIIGVNTRPMIVSGLKLNYDIYSASYFSTYDSPKIKNQVSILDQISGKSCGNFEEKFNPYELIEKAEDFLNEVDYIIPISGISPNDFKKEHKKKILGNKNTTNIENKYKFYKKIKNNFLIPPTLHVKDIDEAIEISKNSDDKQYIVKPLKGSGGYGIRLLNKKLIKQLDNVDSELVIQEYIDGSNLSSSNLSTKNEFKNLVNSRLITLNDLKSNKDFRYVGNILPLDNENINKKIETESEKLIKKFKLIGSNGIDFILNEKGLYIIEINPRLQGTYECVEKALEINMLEEHINACKNNLIKNYNAKNYCIKQIVYSPKRIQYQGINLKNLYDLPYPRVFIEKDQPIFTIIEKNKNYKKSIENLKNSMQIIEKKLKNTN